MLDIGAYRHYLDGYVQEAIENTNGKNVEIYEYLKSKKVSGIFVRHRKEKQKALEEATKAFADHLHWPLEIVISHLGVDVKVPPR